MPHSPLGQIELSSVGIEGSLSSLSSLSSVSSESSVSSVNRLCGGIISTSGDIPNTAGALVVLTV